MKSPRRRLERGLTLIEVAVAMTLLAFGLLAIAPLFASSVKTNASSNQLGNVNALAGEKLEELIGYPATDRRLAIADGTNAAAPPGVATTGPGSIVAANPRCANDLPLWYEPETGGFSFSPSSPGAEWRVFPYTRTYVVEQWAPDLATRVVAPATYSVKLVTVTVRPTEGPFPGLRATTQSEYVRFRDASAN
ncbi:MAG: prepilin-type N-terminal cleavage/methylation domain-containing protein [Acidobacteria bacterium]|nr:prepilin-type N-terminal cleavage/methylation domain-containing protein [Acidobacteriota bacterium]MCA1611752.1 prepilin-type N-terminal cleavage/methylation domain-containing protein [Acidobacteriota bacterium]